MRSMIVLSTMLLTGGLACHEPSPRYDGIEEQPKQFADEHVSFKGPPPEHPAEDRPPGHGTPGTVDTPDVVGGGSPALRAESALDGESQADAVIAPAPGVVSFTGAAELTETPQGVQMAVALSQAPLGQHELTIASPRACQAIVGDEEKRAERTMDSTKADQGNKIGVIDVGRDGEALLKVVLPDATVKAKRERSVLGKSIVIREQAPAGTAENLRGKPGKMLGCGVVTRADRE